MRPFLQRMAVLLGVFLSGCGSHRGAALLGGFQETFPDWSLALYSPMADPGDIPGTSLTEARITLGRMVYYERFVSNGRRVSCNSCHSLTGWDTGGTRPVEADAGRRGPPTLYNVAGQLDYLQVPSVEQRVKASLLSATEMGMPSKEVVLSYLRASPKFRAAFHEAFPSEPDPVTFDNIARAIGAFERGLVTPSRWDRFLEGDTAALTPEEKQGYAKFVATGCSDCHNGQFVGGRMYQRLGAATAWPLQPDGDGSPPLSSRLDPFWLRVASLRNIDQKSGPYFHYGAVRDLPTAVRLMARHQLRTELSDRDVASIVAWLKTLTGAIPSEYIALQRHQGPVR